jgi:ParB-like chromosome segregation protein Spo0J/N6-adenosine-specific RNA methylase IME4
MPELARAEYEELKSDIRLRGVMVPIEHDEHGNILDGHHRLKICEELGIQDYPTVIRAGMTESEKRFHARKLNMARRHLTQEQRREMIRDTLAETPEKSDRQIAEGLGVSNSTVSLARKELEDEGQLCESHTSIGADGKERPRNPNRKPVTVFNPTPAEEKAIQNPAVLEKLAEGIVKTVAEAQREVKRDEIIENLENISAMEAKEIQGMYDVIVIDPPWDMKKIERDVAPTQVEFDYPTMTEEELADLEIPAAGDCHVWLWTTHKYMPTAFRLLEKWNLKYVCTFVWHKPGGFQAFGLPQYNCEFALYARKGAPSFVDAKEFSTCFEAPRTGHSEKPEEFYDMARRVTAGRRLDMFSRRNIIGFDSWGKEAKE